MKIKFNRIGYGEKFTYKNAVVNEGDILDVPKDRAEYYIANGKAEAVKDEPKVEKQTKIKNKGVK